MRYNFRHTTRWFFIALMLCLGASGVAIAQDITGSINGTVRDASGATVAGATVTITDPSKDNALVRTLTTNDDGEFSAPNLLVSIYTVTVEAPNFKKSVQTDVKLDVGQRRSVDFALEAGNISEVVTVEASPIAVETTTPTSSTLINGDQVRELSINNRNWVQLVTLAPGVSSDLSDNVFVGTFNPEAGNSNSVQISVNGARATQNTYTVDGADVTDRGSNLTIQAYPSVDSIGEFKVLRSLYPAESGSSGGGQVNVVTRSGGKRFSGTLYEFVRNEVFNANDFFTNQLASNGVDENGKAKRRPFRYNNFGWTLGGPMYFFNFGEDGTNNPVRRLDKTFFFFSQEFRYDIRYPVLNSTVPNATMRNATFPVPLCIARTYAGETCTGANILPANTPLPADRYNATSRAYVEEIYNNIPLPNTGTFGLLYPARNEISFRQEIFKLDHNFTNNLSAFYRYQQDAIPTLDANSIFGTGSSIPFVSTSESNSPGKTHTFQSTWVINPNMILEARYAHAYGAITNVNTGLLAKENSNIPVDLPFESTRDRVPIVNILNFNQLISYGPYDNFSNKNLYTANLTMIKGSHTMKFGGTFSKYRKHENSLLGNVNEGRFADFASTLPSTTTAAVLAAAGVTSGTAGNYQRWLNFLVGNVGTFTQSKFDLTADFRQTNFESFAQDEWRLRSNVTLYMGVRYSFFGSPVDENGRLTNFVPELFDPKRAAVVTGAGNRLTGNNEYGLAPNFCNGLIINTPGNSDVIVPANCNITASPLGRKVVDDPKLNFAPRIGIAWDPFKNGRTAIRAGYGIYHDQFPVGVFLEMVQRNPPYQETATASNVNISNPVPGDVVFQSTLATGQIRGVQYDWKTPYMQHWSLDWQQQVFDKTMFTIGYYGSKGVHLPGYVDIDLLPAGRALNSDCAAGNNSILTANVSLVDCQPQGYAFRNQTGVPGSPNPSTISDVLILDQIRPFRGYRAISIIQPRFNSEYNSLQVSAQHRFSGASQINVAYTLSKNLTDANAVTTAPQNPYDIAADWGRAALDRRHIFTSNFVYELPFYKSQRGFVGKTLGGWQVSGIITYNTGLAFTATQGSYDPAGIGLLGPSTSAGRAFQISDPNEGAPGTQQQFFNTGAFAPIVPVGSTFTAVQNVAGNAPRGSINGPSTFRFDLTMTKNIRFDEKRRLQLRFEGFNILNRTNFRTIGTALTTPATFGTVTAVRDPRVFQFGVKFYY